MALAAFIALSACHYLAIKWYADYSAGKYRIEMKRWEHMNVVDRQQYLFENLAVENRIDMKTWLHMNLDQQGQYLVDNWPVRVDDLHQILSTDPSGGLILSVKVFIWDKRQYLAWSSPKQAMLPDVRTPWIILGVVYTATFFLLKNKLVSH